MSVITTDAFTEKLTRRFQRAGLKLWVGKSDGDSSGRYLIFQTGGRCISGCGWTRREAEEIVREKCEGKR